MGWCSEGLGGRMAIRAVLTLIFAWVSTWPPEVEGAVAWLDRAEIPNAPSARSGHAMASIGESVYVLGGQDTDENLLNDLHVLDASITPPVWTEISASGAPTPRRRHAMAAVGTRIFVFGGSSLGVYYRDLHEFDASAGAWYEWTDLASGPSARNQHCMAGVGSKVYLFGGSINGGSAISAELWELDATNSTPVWTVLTSSVLGPPPPSRLGAVMAAVGTKIFLHGGARGLSTALDTLDELDTASLPLTWVSRSSAGGAKPSPRFYHAAAGNSDGSLYVYGGQMVALGSYFSDLYEYSTAGPLWRQVTTASGDYASEAYLLVTPGVRNRLAMAGVGANRSFVFGGVDNSGAPVQGLLEFDTGYVLACDRGDYLSGGACVACPANTTSFLASDELSDCECIEGLEGPAAGPCTECGIGTFKTWRAFSAPSLGRLCLPCPPGTWRNTTGAGECTACPPGKWTGNASGSISPSACVCATGAEDAPGGGCMCSAGYYGDADVGCVRCPDFADSPVNSSSASQCTCRAGYAGVGGLNCSACGAGEYKEAPGNVPCTACPAGTTTPPASANLSECVCTPGYEGSADGQACTPCAIGFYREANGTGSCLACNLSTTDAEASPAQSDCVCAPGAYGPPGGGVCQLCAKGGFANATNLSECYMCPRGATTAADGAVNASQCLCAVGYEGVGDACKPCSNSTYKDVEGAGNCSACLHHTTSPAGSVNLSACVCHPNATGPGPGEACVCSAGFYEEGGNKDACMACPQFATSPENSTNATQCVCLPGYAGAGPAPVCTPCAPGSYKNFTGEGECTACPVGANSSFGAVDVTQCTCPPGYEGDDGGPCSPCALGFYKVFEGNGTCMACSELATTLLEGSVNVSECTCVRGATGPGGLGGCVNCSAGTYKEAAGPASCDVCPLNSTSPEGSSSLGGCVCMAGFEGQGQNCTACPISLYKDFVGPGVCVRCPPKTTSPMGSDNVTDCVCAESSSGPGGGPCACAIGFYEDARACVACPPNTTSEFNSTSLAECVCAPGYTGSGGAGGCEPCSAGSFKDVAGNSTCSACANGTTSLPASGDVSGCFCLPGYEGASNGLECSACLQGFWKGVPGAGACTPCPQDSSTSAEGTVDVLACTCVAPNAVGPAGGPCACSAGYGGDVGVPCNPCPLGTYKGSVGTVACTPCPTPLTTPALGTTNSSECLCEAGAYVDAGGACVPCDADSYKSAIGEGTCTSCPLDTTTGGQAGGSAEDCECVVGFTDPCNNTVGSYPGIVSNNFGQAGGAFYMDIYLTTTGPASAISVQYFDLRVEIPVGTFQTLKVWLRPDSSLPDNNWELMSDTLKSSTIIADEGANVYVVRAELMFPLVLQKGRVYGLALHGDGEWAHRYTTLSTPDFTAQGGGQTYSDGELEIRVGMSSSVPFVAPRFNPRGFNGRIGYCVEPCTRTVGSWPGLVATNFGQAGGAIYFDALLPETSIAPSSVTVQFFDLQVRSAGGTFNGLKVFLRPNSSLLDDGWELVSDTLKSNSILSTINAGNSEFVIRAELLSPFVLSKGQVYGVALHGDGDWSHMYRIDSAYQNMTSTGGGQVYDFGDLIVRSGTASQVPFGSRSNPRVFAGRIGYCINNTACAPCPADTYKSSVGGQQCLECPTGTESSPGSEQCTCKLGAQGPPGGPCVCAPGYYGDPDVGCTPCPSPAQTSAVGSVVVTDCLCSPGYTGFDGSFCFACGAGQYKTVSGSSACLTCPGNTTSPLASTSISNCTCVKGHTAFQSGVPCAPCPVNSYKNVTGALPCVVCPPLAVTLARGSVNEVDCVCGLGASGPAGGPCSECVPGTYKNETGSPQNCTACPKNATSPAGSDVLTDCVCQPGFEGLLVGAACSPCPPDFFQPVIGAPLSCRPCPNGTTTFGASGAPLCQCTVGSTGPLGGPCSCDVGYYGDAELLCMECPRFATSPVNSTVVTDCECQYPYEGPPGGQCSIESFAWIDRTGLLDQPLPRQGHAAAAMGSLMYMFGGVRSTLAEGTRYFKDLYLFDTTVFPFLWADLSAIPGGPSVRHGHLLESVAGRLWLFGGADEEEFRGELFEFTPGGVGGGTWRDYTGLPNAPVPRYRMGSAVVGNELYILSGTAAQIFTDFYRLRVSNTTGVAPLWTDLSGQPGLPSTRESPGMVSVNESLYVFGGFAGLPPAQPIFPVDFLKYNTTSQTWSTALSGLEGQPPPRRQHGMTAIGSRIFVFGGQGPADDPLNDLHELDVAFDPPRWSFLQELTVERPTPRRLFTFTAVRASSIMVTFGLGQLFEGATVETSQLTDVRELETLFITNCPEGTWKELSVGTVGCSRCPLGTTSPLGSTNRSDCTCLPGWEGQVSGTACTRCSPGFAKPSLGLGVCTPCGPSTYTDFLGAAQCTPCPPNSDHTLTGRSNVSACLCDAGYAGSFGQCVACPIGTYSDSVGALACTQCPTNSATVTNATTSLFDCVCTPGYEGFAGQACTPCPVGEWKNVTGEDVCLPCPPLTTSPEASPSVSSCVCVPGSAGTPCAPCNYSAYQGALGQPACNPCPVGTTTRNLSTIEIRDCVCALGYEGALDGAACAACPVGFYKDFLSVGTCSKCPKLSTSPAAGERIEDCACDPGAGFLEGTCLCRGGFYENSSTGKHVCSQCPSFSYSPPNSTSRSACVCEYPYSGPNGGPCTFDLPVWRTRTAPPGGARMTPAMAAVGELLYAFGGTGSGGGRTLQCFNTSEWATGGTWLDLGSIPGGPSPRRGHSMVEMHGVVYLFGGLSTVPLGDFFAFDPAQGANGAWRSLNVTDGPFERYEHAMAAAALPNGKGSLWMFGGRSSVGDWLTDLWQYNVGEGGKWTLYINLPGAPSARSQLGMAHVLGKVYVLWGEGIGGLPASGVYSLDVRGSKPYWNRTRFNNEPPARRAHGAVAVGTRIYVFGGSLGLTGVVNQLWELETKNITDPVNLRFEGWYDRTGLPNQPTPRRLLAMAPLTPTSSKLYVLGGENGLSQALNGLWELDTRVLMCGLGLERINRVCSPCAIGEYKDTIQLKDCVTCPGGSSTDEIGSTGLEQCNCLPGFSGLAGEVCQPCPLGEYKNFEGPGLCTTCPPGTTTLQVAAINETFCVCKIGAEGPPAGPCTCSLGYYGDADTQCDACPPGATTLKVGRAVVGQCVCDSGYTGPAGGPCPSCLEGEYKAVVGNVPCAQCPNGTTSLLASTNLSDCVCALGFAGDADGEACEACNTSFYKDSVGVGECLPCPPNTGTFLTASPSLGSCGCLPGSYGPPGTGLCNLCPPGTYNDIVIAVVCFPCPVGSLSTIQGASSDAQCECLEGYTGPGGFSCAPCAPGTFKNYTGEGVCYACPPRTTSLEGGESADDCFCEDGSEGPPGGPCICSIGFWENSSATPPRCESCPEFATTYQVDSRSSKACVCLSGYFGNGTVQCAECPVGTYQPNTNASACVACPNGTTTVPTANSTSVSLSQCLCDVGFIGTNGANCSACPVSEYKDTIGAAFNCTTCPDLTTTAGRAGGGALGECLCVAGAYANETGMACALCPPGNYSDVLGSTSCAACPPQSTSLFEGAAAVTDCVCSAGSTGDAVAGCFPCQNGTYKDYDGLGKCTLCPPGATSPEGSMALDECVCQAGAVATLIPGTNGTSGTNGTNGTVGVNGTNGTAPTAPTAATAGTDTTVQCLCDAGFYTNPNASDFLSYCLPCPGNSTSPFNSSSFDQCLCVEGYAGANASVCAPCDIGFYSDTQGQDECTPCPPFSTTVNTTSPTATACECLPGYSGRNGEVCEPCPVSFYKPTVGPENCTRCGARSSTALPNSTNVSQCICAPGSEVNETQFALNGDDSCICSSGYEGLSFLIACEPCPLGFYKPLEGNTLCDLCPPLSSTPFVSSFDVSECECVPGSFLGPDGNCTLCAEGKYQELPGQASCLLCPPFSTSPEGSANRTNCTCLPGYEGAAGKTCTPCPMGRYKPDVGSDNCTVCPTSTSTPTNGSVNLTQCVCVDGSDGEPGGPCVCVEGFYADSLLVSNFTQCLQCPNRTTSPYDSTVKENCTCLYPFFGDPGGPCVIDAFRWSYYGVLPNAPEGVFLPGLVSIGLDLYAHGGQLSNGSVWAGLERVDTSGLEPVWVPGFSARVRDTGMPPRYAHGLAALPGVGPAGSLFVYGGVNASGGVMGDAWVLGLDGDTNGTIKWVVPEIRGFGAVPAERKWFGFAAEGTRVWMYGGRDGTGAAVDSLFYADIDGAGANAPYLVFWERVTVALLANGSFPQARWAPGFALSGGIAYVHGGMADGGVVLADLHAFYLEGGRGYWVDLSAQPGPPSARYGHAMIGFTKGTKYERDKLILFGGRDAGGADLQDTWEADVNDGAPAIWSDLSEADGTVPSARYGMGNAAMGRTLMWVFGGISDTEYLRDLGRLDTNTSDEICNPGFYNQESTCVACEAGRFMNGIVPRGLTVPIELCVPCPANATSEPASVGVESCRCLPGFTGEDGAECTPCPENTYKYSIGNATCQPCEPVITGSGAASAICECEPGYNPNITLGIVPSGAGCVLCGGGFYKLHRGNEQCDQCGEQEKPVQNAYWLDPAPADLFCPFLCDEGFSTFGITFTEFERYECLPCEGEPLENPCSAGEYWNATCTTLVGPGCQECQNMVGNGIYRLPNYFWREPDQCPYSCNPGSYDSTPDSGNFMYPDCVPCTTDCASGFVPGVCGLGGAFGILDNSGCVPA